MDDLNEILEIVRHYARGIWKNRWIAIVIAWPLMIGGIIAVDQIKDRYKAETQVYIDSSSVLKPLLRGLTISTDFQSTVRLMVRKLLSRPNLERAIRLMDMDINVQTPQQMEALINKVRSRVEITAVARTGTYTITYSDEIPQTAKKMVQTLLDIFVEDTLGKSVDESDNAIAFLDKQIAKYEKLLQEAEKRREEFKRKNMGLMPKDGANYFSQLQQIKVQLEDTRLSLREAVNRRDKILNQLAEMDSVEIQQTTSTSYDERIEEQEIKLQDLLLMYTEQHPDVINTQLVLDTLQKRRESELKELQQNSSPNLRENPVYQELLIAKANLEGDISTLSTRVAAFSRKQRELEKLVDIVPAIESEMQKLNRDYDVHKGNYTELVERRETARISEDVESGTEQVKFRIIEPPFVPARADYPNRALFDVAVIIFALGVGYGVGLLISLFQPVFYNTADLRKYTEHAVLGAISKIDTPQVLSQRRRNLIYFASANVVFILVGGVLTLFHSRGMLILSDLQISGDGFMSILSKAFGKNKKAKSSNTGAEHRDEGNDQRLLEEDIEFASKVQKDYAASETGAIDIPLNQSSNTPKDVIDLSGVDLRVLDIDLSVDMDHDTLSQAGNLLEINPLKSFSRQVEIDLKGLEKKGYITPQNANDPLANTFRVIKRPLLNNAAGKSATAINKANMIMVTSAMNGEGKSFSAINLAISVAMEKDKHVLLVDADVNKPSHHEIFGIPMESGLIDLLLRKEKDMSQILHKTNIPSLSLMFAGNQSSQATELLASESMDRFVEEVASRYPDRIVIFDSPPLLLTTESSVLASYMGQVVMVVEAEKTLRHHVLKGLDLLSNDVVLMMLNKMREKNELGNYGTYGYGHKP